jgi:4-hydroxy-tetrahydrodipicolinate synthase
VDWYGVFAAITTPFNEDCSLDERSLDAHVRWMIAGGCRGIVPLGSLGEASTLTANEKKRILEICVAAAQGSGIPVVAGVAGLRTAEAVELARTAQASGCDALMVLPPYVYRGDQRETETHFDAVLRATPLSCMLYNNPVAYGTDVLPERVAVLAQRHANLHAVKESSGDVRRVSEIRRLLGDRIAIFCGVDDLIVEALHAGAAGWIAGLVNALPDESVHLFNLVTGSEGVPANASAARELYEWFLPLLRLDTVPKFVQLIKLVQAVARRGSARVRPPRLELEGAELEAYESLIRFSLERAPRVSRVGV